MATPSESNYPRPESSGDLRHATPEVYAYLGLLSVFFLMPGSIAFTPLQFLYKNELHLHAGETATFKLLINLPGMLAFLFGIIRDRYNPLKMGDRGFLLCGGIATAAVYAAMSSLPMTRTTLGAGLVLVGITAGLIGAAFNALMRNIAEARMMSGRMSALSNFMSGAVGAVMLILGGVLTDHLSWRFIFIIVAICYALLGLLGLLKPEGVFRGIPAGGDRSFKDLGRDAVLLFQHRGFWIAVVINAVWAFTPAGGTPLMYYFTNSLKMSPTQYSLYLAMFNFGFIPFVMLFGLLCKRMSLWRLLLFSTIVAIPQWVPVIFVHSPLQAYAQSVFAGATGGLATAAYFGLLLRACPKNLAGTGMLLSSGISLLFVEAGNVLGGHLYDWKGFPACMIVTTGAYVLLIPLCFLIPRALVDPPDDKHVPTEEELIAA